MILFITLSLISLICGLAYLFHPASRFSFDVLLLSLWAMAIGLAQLRLSPYEQTWSLKFWLVLMLFFTILFVTYHYLKPKWAQHLSTDSFNLNSKPQVFVTVMSGLTLLSLTVNLYIFWQFGTLPLLSSVPDKMRFIINREVFGLWEYLALLPRLIIPLIFICLTAVKTNFRHKIILIANIIIGFLILTLYASRLIMVLPILLCYFSFLSLKHTQLNWPKIISASTATVLIILIIAVSIPALRHYITYRDYYSDLEYTPFTYLADLSDIKIPARFHFLIPLYIIPAFNLQALNNAIAYYPDLGLYHGAYSYGTFDAALELIGLPGFNIQIPWKEIFLPWWVTATFIFNYWADLGWLGIAIGGMEWGIILSLIYVWATKKPTLLSVSLFSYFSFVVIMTIYTNYFLREEFYLDILLLIILGLIFKPKSDHLRIEAKS